MRKIYGQSRIEPCPFCGRNGIVKNKQGIAVCQNHRDSGFKDLKCACGGWLDIREGKFGAYFHCFNCGNISLKKALEMNPIQKKENQVRKEITVRSDELEFL